MTEPRPAPEFGPPPPYRQPKLPPLTNVLYSQEGPVATVTINREDRLNCLNYVTLTSLVDAFRHASWDDSVAVIVLTGAGERAFCTGADLEEQATWMHERPRDYWKWFGRFAEAMDGLRRIGKPTIARLNGAVVGGGNEFNLACDLAIAADDAFIQQVGPARGSVPAAGATQWLPLTIGQRRAAEMLLELRRVDAKTALEWGLVNRVVPRSQLDSAVAESAARLAATLPECMRYTKQQLDFWRELGWSQTVWHARDWLTLHAGATETLEGARAFYDRREIDYAGLRGRMAAGESVEYSHGRPHLTCPACGTGDLPSEFRFCGRCGAALLGP
ncbi:MAG: enoyl-CoA hydratase-related protein [Candidatus Dormibacteria bacterium]